MANPLETIKAGLRDSQSKELSKVSSNDKSGKGNSVINTDWAGVDKAANRIRASRGQKPMDNEGPLIDSKKYFRDINEANTPEFRKPPKSSKPASGWGEE